MNQQFVNRKEELMFLEKYYSQQKSQFIVLYGRRRVGKTELVKEFMKNKKHVYFLSEVSSIEKNISKISNQLGQYLGNDLLQKSNLADFEDLFRLFLNLKKNDDKLVIAIDEFPYLIELDRSIPSIFQKIWGDLLKDRKDITLILFGSSISMMETEVLGYSSPLYGRRTAQWKVNELDIRHIKRFLPNYNIEEQLLTYGILGGIPLYLQLFSDNKDIYENINEIFLWKGGFMYEEAENILKQEFREPKNYKLILEAIAEGKTKSGEIINFTGIDKTAISRYAEILQNLGIIGYELPLLAPKKSKNRAYFIKDNYFRFWFKFIYPQKNQIEEGRTKEVMHYIKANISQYFGYVFERICFLSLLNDDNINYEKLGRQWGKTKSGAYEIDIVGLNEQTKEILFAECKWQENVDAKKLLAELKEKAGYVEWHNDKRKETFAIFAKSFKNKKVDGVQLYDLKDLEKIFTS